MDNLLEEYKISLESSNFDLAKIIVLEAFHKNSWCFIPYSVSNGFLPDALTYFLPKNVIDFQDENNPTMLHLTIWIFLESSYEAQSRNYPDFLKLVRLLLDHGANPNIKNEWGNTPPHFAVRTCSIDMISLLCKSGGDIYIINKADSSPRRTCAETLLDGYLNIDDPNQKYSWFCHIDACEQALIVGYYNQQYLKIRNNTIIAFVMIVLLYFVF